MHFVFYWTSDKGNEKQASPELEACFAEYESVEVMPQFHVIHITGHGHQEVIEKRFREVTTRLAALNITYLISPLIIGGQYQGRLFDEQLALRVNELTDEPS